MMSLEERIRRRKAEVGVIGLGYVGLPLAVEFARCGFSVVGFDVSREKVQAINAGTSYIPDVASETVQEHVKCTGLRATEDFAALRNLDAVTICVPTPLRQTKDPDISHIVAAAREVKKHLHRDFLIVLQSTTYPGTTEEVLLPEFEETGFRVGTDFYLAFSPERIDPGNRVYNTRNTPKIIGGVTPACGRLATLLYQQAVDTVIPVSSARCAEMVKQLENTFRAVNIGLVNEIAIMCHKLGLDVWEVIGAAATKPFGFMPFFPGPGLGGHCIPVDPRYLAWKLKALNYNARFIELASEVNTAMPEFVFTKICKALNQAKKPVNGSRILVLGVAYKKDVGDVRESPSLDIMRLLQADGAQVDYYDPHVPTLEVDELHMRSIQYEAERLREYDCVVIVTDHSAFDYDGIAQNAPLIFDSRNALKRNAPNIIKL
ncbi:MAG: nucleotide sugar dehydrogenase [Acidobacteria bacterium]|nr:nucleotide sugar dehydrogenase [Acidobacteriota bacterium]